MYNFYDDSWEKVIGEISRENCRSELYLYIILRQSSNKLKSIYDRLLMKNECYKCNNFKINKKELKKSKEILNSRNYSQKTITFIYVYRNQLFLGVGRDHQSNIDIKFDIISLKNAR